LDGEGALREISGQLLKASLRFVVAPGVMRLLRTLEKRLVRKPSLGEFMGQSFEGICAVLHALHPREGPSLIIQGLLARILVGSPSLGGQNAVEDRNGLRVAAQHGQDDRCTEKSIRASRVRGVSPGCRKKSVPRLGQAASARLCPTQPVQASAPSEEALAVLSSAGKTSAAASSSSLATASSLSSRYAAGPM
jgi:hypothetical protein